MLLNVAYPSVCIGRNWLRTVLRQSLGMPRWRENLMHRYWHSLHLRTLLFGICRAPRKMASKKENCMNSQSK